MLHIIYAIISVVIPCVIYQIFILWKKNKESKKDISYHLIMVLLFLIYIGLTFYVTGIGSIWDLGYYEKVIRVEEINLIPLQSKNIIQYVLNIIMFVPFGFLLPLLWEEYRKFIKVVLAGLSFSLAIELCQLLNHRTTDIDDLLMNTLGAIVGYGIWHIFRNLFKKISKKSTSLSKNEPIIYLVLAVLGELFLYNWRLLP